MNQKCKILLTKGSNVVSQPRFRGVLNVLGWSGGLQTLYTNTTVRVEAKREVFFGRSRQGQENEGLKVVISECRFSVKLRGS